MPYNFPFFGFPNFRRNFYHNNNSFLHNYESSTNYSPLNSYNINQKNSSDSFCSKESEDVQDIDLFGLKLQSDDLLILAILFFLYKEGCDDIYIYVALFLLLIS